jgi:CRP-like cAMP-binding protein
MKPEQIEALLRRTKLFGSLDPASLADLAREATPRFYKRNDIIWHEDDPGEAVLILAEGLVKVFLTSPNGDEMVLATPGPPESLGELALVHRGTRSASARAIKDTKAVALTRDTFAALMRQHPAMTETVMETLGALLERTLAQAADLVFLDLPGRVAKLLVGLADSQEARGAECVVRLEVKQADLAGMVGGSRPAVNQILKTFQERGYLEPLGGGSFRLDVDALRRRAG